MPSDTNPTYNQGPNIGKRVYYSTNALQNYTQQSSSEPGMHGIGAPVEGGLRVVCRTAA